MTRFVFGVEQEPHWQGKPKHPIRDALMWLCGKPPPKYVQGYDFKNLDDNQTLAIQEWAVQQLDKTPVFWATGIGMLDAAEKIVEEAVSNGNIPGPDSWWRTDGSVSSVFLTRRKKKKVVKK